MGTAIRAVGRIASMNKLLGVGRLTSASSDCTDSGNNSQSESTTPKGQRSRTQSNVDDEGQSTVSKLAHDNSSMIQNTNETEINVFNDDQNMKVRIQLHCLL